MLLLDRLVSIEPTPLSNRPECPAQAILGRLASHHPKTSPRANPVVSETQQVKSSWRFSTASILPVGLVRWATKRNQPRLVWVQGQAVLTKTLGQYFQNPPGVFFTGKAHDEVIRVADKKGTAS